MTSYRIAMKVLVVGALALGGFGALHAGTLYSAFGPASVELTFPDSTFDIGVTGTAAFLSADFSSNPVGFYDPGPPTTAHPGNSVLGAEDGTLTQYAEVFFIVAGAAGGPNGHLLIPGQISALTTVTDPGLANMLGVVQFDFAPNGDGSFSLASVSSTVPEPAAPLLAFVGLVGIALGWRGRRSAR